MDKTECVEPIRRSACEGACSQCAATDSDSGDGIVPGPLSGRPFALAAAGHFLVPVFLACAGAALGDDHGGQFIGAAVGLGIGMLVSTLVARRRRAYEETVWEQH